MTNVNEEAKEDETPNDETLAGGTDTASVETPEEAPKETPEE